ncbi:hypothetical protein [Allomuricauda sp. CAU 1633]|nr:hypothetical protein [Muricauda sp. CAU 1633]
MEEKKKDNDRKETNKEKKYEKKLKINGTLEDVLKVSVDKKKGDN